MPVMHNIPSQLINRGWSLDRVHNSCRPLNSLTLIQTLTFDLILIGGRRLVVDYPCAKFGDLSFSRLCFIVWADTQTALNALLPQLLPA